jgi:radical SAM family uncharacterized protein/radical SAM-linked protein
MTELKAILEKDVLPFVEKPLRYVGNELNIIRKDLSRVTLHGVFCFPDLYDIGMSHLGLQILYHIVNREPSWALSRCFHPWADMEAKMRELHTPLYSLEYTTPVRDADWIGFSVQYELHGTNLLNMLDLAGIPLVQRDRGPGDPLVIAGGPCMGNPEPFADFVDACVIGDGEETVVSLCQVMEQKKQVHAGRDETLAAFANINGVYVPSLFTVKKRGMFFVADRGDAPPVRAAKVAALLDKNYPEAPLVPIIDVVHHRLAVEVMRGCTRGCRFCSAGTYYRPVRERDPGELHRRIEREITATGWRDVGLLSLSTADSSCFAALLNAAESLKRHYHVAFSLPSTRVDALAPEQFDLLASVSPVSSLTIAPEAGSDRLRRVINKEFSDEAIFAAIQTLLDRGVQTIKLYFMTGLPTETEGDISAIIEMVRKISGMARAASHRRTINVSLSPFSPKPQTPFQWEAMDSLESLDRKNTMIKKGLGHLKNVRVSYRNVHMALLETVIARGDRAVGMLIRKAWERGARFDGWDDLFVFNRWSQAAQEISMDITPYTGAIPPDQYLPWSIVNTGVSQQFLEQERSRSRSEEVTADCRHGDCGCCGVCTGAQKKITAPPVIITALKPSGSNPMRSIAGGPLQERTAYRYRFTYSKGAAVRFLGHLDMAAVFLRALTGAGFALHYSQGYEPRPQVSFGPPLPFGVMGDAEAFDATAAAPITGDPLRVNAMLPPDLRVVSVNRIDGKCPSLTSSIKGGRYRFIPVGAMEAITVRKAINDVLEATTLPVTISKNGGTRIKDIRPLIQELRLNNQDSVALQAVLSLDPGATCKPSELISVLFPRCRFSDFLVTRSECLIRSNGNLTGLHEGGAL